jgi:hypothetical protein
MRSNPGYHKEFFDKLRRKKDDVVQDVKKQTTDKGNPQEKRVKRYTSGGKPLYE